MKSMRRRGLLVAVALLIASGGTHAAPVLSGVGRPAPSRVEGPIPVIVELFTSEGCSDCPPADTLLDTLIATQPIAGAQIIGLGQHVDYWDRLGWRDRFSSAALTSRQQVYQTRFRTESIYTPQMVVDGRAEFVGSDGNAARKAIEKTLTAHFGAELSQVFSEFQQTPLAAASIAQVYRATLKNGQSITKKVVY